MFIFLKAHICQKIDAMNLTKFNSHHIFFNVSIYFLTEGICMDDLYASTYIKIPELEL